jgi:hypothetical protein
MRLTVKFMEVSKLRQYAARLQALLENDKRGELKVVQSRRGLFPVFKISKRRGAEKIPSENLN